MGKKIIMNNLDEYVTKRDVIETIKDCDCVHIFEAMEIISKINELLPANVIPITEAHDVYAMSNTETVFGMGNRKFIVTEII